MKDIDVTLDLLNDIDNAISKALPHLEHWKESRDNLEYVQKKILIVINTLRLEAVLEEIPDTGVTYLEHIQEHYPYLIERLKRVLKDHNKKPTV